ncbi:hypothetical protein [Sediminibacterium sp. KACHI17]
MKDVMMILHFIGLTMGLGTGFANAFLSSVTSKMTVNDAVNFRLQILALSKMGYLGITLLLISGVYLINPYWNSILMMPLLVIKLALVLILVILITLIGHAGSKAKVGDTEMQFKKMELFGKLALLTGVCIVVVAVLMFH